MGAISCHDPKSHLALELHVWLVGECHHPDKGPFPSMQSLPGHLQVIGWSNNLKFSFSSPCGDACSISQYFATKQHSNPPLTYHHHLQFSCQLLKKSPETELPKQHFAPSWPWPDCSSLLTALNAKRRNEETSCTAFANTNFEYEALISGMQVSGILELIFFLYASNSEIMIRFSREQHHYSSLLEFPGTWHHDLA